MAKHIVKCLYCGQEFDANVEEYVMPNSRRYAHKRCAEGHIDYNSKIHNLMKNLLGVEYSYSRIASQIKRIKDQEKTTEEEIYNTLDYWYNVLHNTAEKANGGIGIVSYILGQYRRWAKEQFENSQLNEGKSIKEYVNKKPRQVIGRITPIQKPRHIIYYELK